MSSVTVECRVVGRSKPVIADWAVPLPPELSGGDGAVTLRDLITCVVVAEVDAFNRRQSEACFIRVLSENQIREGMVKGKIDCGGKESVQEACADDSVAAALQAFEDGLYIVAVDGEQKEELDREVHVRPGSRVAFIRLAMLAGG